jgi:hypothetical protein
VHTIPYILIGIHLLISTCHATIVEKRMPT